MTSTALALHGSHGIDTEKPHVEVYQCQCLEYIMLFVADKTHVTATNNMKENMKERIEYYITIYWKFSPGIVSSPGDVMKVLHSSSPPFCVLCYCLGFCGCCLFSFFFYWFPLIVFLYFWNLDACCSSKDLLVLSNQVYNILIFSHTIQIGYFVHHSDYSTCHWIQRKFPRPSHWHPY